MTSETFESDLQFNLSGDGLAKLPKLAKQLASVDAAASTLVANLSVTTAKVNTNTAAVRRAATAYRNYTLWVRKARDAQRELAKYAGGTPLVVAKTASAPAASAAATPKGDGGSAAAAKVEAISAARSVAITKAKEAKKVAITEASSKMQREVISAQATSELATLQLTDARAIAIARATAAERLAISKAQIDRELAIRIAAQEKAIAVAKAEARSAIATVSDPSDLVQARIYAAEELAITQAEAAQELTVRKAKEAEATAIRSAGAKARIAMAKAEAAASAASAAASPWAKFDDLSNTRYALYDVSRTAGVASVALAAMLVVPVVKAAQFTKSFNSVERTLNVTGEEAAALKQEFIDLSTSMPTGFSELAGIGTVAGQLDIAAEAATGFTKNVAMFSATTGVATEEAATNIGRMAQLTHTASAEYDNLTAAIYQVGVTSVATEGEILDMGSQIATAGDLAGLTNDQVVALAGALSSLGVQPEAARGSLQRIFNIIENGAAGSSKATQQLADISGMTIEEMKGLWNDGAGGSQKFFSAFVAGLGQIQDSGGNTSNVLYDLGVNAVRDQRLLQVLANNTDVYNQALEQSASAYAQGTAMSDAYDRQTDNLIDNLKELGNTLSAILAAGGQDPALNFIVKSLNEMAKSALALAQSPLGGFLLTVGGGVAAFGLAITLATFATTKLQGAIFGMLTAAKGLNGGVNSNVLSIGNLTRQIIQLTIAFARGNLTAERAEAILNGVTVSSERLSAGLNGATLASTRFGAALGFVQNGAERAGAAIGAMSTVKTLGWMIAITAAITALTWAWEEFNKTAQDRADEVLGAQFGSTLSDALAADQKAVADGADYVRSFDIRVTDTTSSLTDWASELENASGAQVGLNKATTATNEATRLQTVYIGKATAAAINSAIVNNEKLQSTWAKYGPVLKQSGFDMSEWFKQLTESGDSGTKYLDEKINELSGKLTLLDNLSVNTGGAVDYQSGDPGSGRTAETLAIMDQLTALKALREISGGVSTELSNVGAKQQIVGQLAKAAGVSEDDMADALGGVADAANPAAAAIDKVIAAAQNTRGVQQAWYDLGQSIGENGKVFNGFSDAAQKNIDSVMNLTDQLKSKAGSDTQAYGESIMGVMLDLQNQGVNTGGSLSYLGDILNATLGTTYNLDFNSVDAQNSLMDVINAAISTQQELVQTQIIAMQTAAIANDSAAYAAASAGMAQAQQRLAQLEALRTLALNSMSSAQKAYNSGLSQGTQNLHKNTAASKKNADQTKKTARTYKDWADDIKSVMDRADDLRWGVQRALADIDDATAKAVSTMLNEMYNLDGAYNRVFLQRVTQDNYLSMWYEMQDAARDAADAVTKAANDILDAQAELLSISSDRASLQYGLQVAIDYGDALREQSIRAKLAELDAKEAAAARDLANAQHDLSDAQDSQNKSLTDNSQQAIKNRATVKDLLGTYSDYLSRLVDSGASAQDLTDAVAQSKLDFLAQGKALGFSAAELETYVSLFDRYMATSGSVTNDATKAVDDLYSSWEDYILSLISSGASQDTINRAIRDGKTAVANLATQMGLSKTETKKYADAFAGLSEIVKKIPKNVNIGINANKDAAINAINEFLKSKAVSDLRSLGGGVNIPIKVTADDNGVDKKIRKAMLMTQMADYLQLYAMYLGRGDRSRAGDAKKSYDAIKKKIASGNYYTGGYTGRGGKYEYAGIVHKREYVVPAHEVNQSTGQPYFMERVSSPVVQNVSVPTVMQVELSPTDRALLDNGGAVIELRVDGKLMTAVVNRHNKTNALRGSK